MSEAKQLLAEYAKTGSEAAFREVVTRYLSLVHSTAVRLVEGDSHLAEDVTQKVFADLAKMAGNLGTDAMLGGWLHRHTCFIASKTIRTERRRKARELQAVQMNELEDHSQANLGAVAPILDEAINNLGAQDRQAILLRYFEQRDLRSVGQALGSNEDAARKRVSRALDKLREMLKRRGVTLSTSALASALAAQAVTAAPAGLAVVITTSALATAAAGGGTALTLLHIMSMTKLQGGVIAAITVALSIPLVIQYQAKTKLRDENQSLRSQVEQLAAVTEENRRLSNLVAKAQQPSSPAYNEQFRELMKLRGEVAVLRGTANEALTAAAAAKPTGESALSGITSNPEMSKMIRDQQKLGLGMVYKGFEKRANLPKEKIEELNNLLADEVMTNINHITEVLRDGKTGKALDDVFTKAEAETKEKVKALLGPEAFAKYEEYSEQMASYITAEQFKSMLPGEKEAKDAKAKQLYELMEEEKKRTLAAQGLRDDHQLIPTLNFRNIASEEEGEKSLQLLDTIYDQVQTRAGSFLTPEEIEKFAEFRKLAVNNNRVALTLNRKLMAPGAKQ
ncbi:MAG: RNA polymerase sigma factor [Limisphaerales bacterium]